MYKTDNRGATWSLIWVPPLDAVPPVNPNLGVGIADTMFGVKLVKLDPRNPKIVYATAFNNAIHRSAPSLENGRRVVQARVCDRRGSAGTRTISRCSI